MTIGELLTRNARSDPAGEALVFEDRRCTWQDLEGGANRCANALLGLGANKGDRALLLLDNCIEFVDCFFGMAKIGGVSAPCLTNSVGKEIAYIANDLGAQFIIAQASALPAIAEVRDRLDTVRHVIGVGDGNGADQDYEALMQASAASAPDIEVAADDILTVKYTSGTTGSPKGCVRTHRNFIAAAEMAQAAQPLAKTETTSIVSPLAAGLAISELVKYIMCGARTVMLRKFDALEYLRLIEQEKITLGYAMPATGRRFFLAPAFAEFDLSSLRIFTVPPDPECAAAAAAHPTFRAGYQTGYGSSEAGGRITFINPEDYRRAESNARYAAILDSLGRTGAGVRVEAVDDDLRPVAAGELGEMAIAGPTVFKEYLGRPEETAKVFRDGWLLTGDLIRKDAEGYIYLCGRKRDMIKTGGINVYPAEIEPVIRSHPKVAEVAVVGIPDAEWEEMVVACVVATEPCTEAEIIDFCRDKLAGHKRPKRVRFFDALPANESGKVVNQELIARLLEEKTTNA